MSVPELNDKTKPEIAKFDTHSERKQDQKTVVLTVNQDDPNKTPAKTPVEMNAMNNTAAATKTFRRTHKPIVQRQKEVEAEL